MHIQKYLNKHTEKNITAVLSFDSWPKHHFINIKLIYEQLNAQTKVTTTAKQNKKKGQGNGKQISK